MARNTIRTDNAQAAPEPGDDWSVENVRWPSASKQYYRARLKEAEETIAKLTRLNGECQATLNNLQREISLYAKRVRECAVFVDGLKQGFEKLGDDDVILKSAKKESGD